MEQQLQVTAGDLADAERRLTKLSLSKKADKKSRSTNDDPDSRNVIMAGGHLVSIHSMRRDYGAVMQVNNHSSVNPTILFHLVPLFFS